MLTDGFHLLLAHIGGQHKFPAIFVAIPAHAHAQIHLGHLARHMTGQDVKVVKLRRFCNKQLTQEVKVFADVSYRRVVRLQVARVPCQQITPLTRFRVEHLTNQLVDGAAGLLGLLKVGDRSRRLLKTGFVDENKKGRCQDGQWHADGHLGQGKFFQGKLRSVLQ